MTTALHCKTVGVVVVLLRCSCVLLLAVDEPQAAADDRGTHAPAIPCGALTSHTIIAWTTTTTTAEPERRRMVVLGSRPHSGNIALVAGAGGSVEC